MGILKKLNRLMCRVKGMSSVCGLSQAMAFELSRIARKESVSLRIKGYANRLTLRRAESDYMVFRTVFIDRELDMAPLNEPRLIIDAGANVGFSTLWFATAYPGAKVIAVEPSGDACQAIRAHCAGMDRVQVLESALWSEPRTLHIANPDDMSWARRVEPDEGDSVEPLNGVPAVTVGDLLARAGVERCDLLKMDIEGAEVEVFTKNFASWLDRVDAILVEVHGEAALAAIDKACPEDVFDRKQCGDKLLLQRSRLSQI